MARFPSSITLTTVEAIDLVAELEDASEALATAGYLAAAAAIDEQVRVLQGKLSEGWS